MPKAPRVAVLGFRPHTYWTAAVALAGKAAAPEVMARRRIDFASGETRQVYHRIEGMTRADAEGWLAQVWAITEANARSGIDEMLNSLKAEGVTVDEGMVPIGRVKVPDRLEDVLASHSYMHAAEGDFYRGVVAEACSNLGLAVHRVIERNLAGEVASLIGAGPAALGARLKAMGAPLGPPWSEDQKLAALAAWTRLF